MSEATQLGLAVPLTYGNGVAGPRGQSAQALRPLCHVAAGRWLQARPETLSALSLPTRGPF